MITAATMSMFKPYRFLLNMNLREPCTLYSMPEGWILVPDAEHLPARRLTETQANLVIGHSELLTTP